MSTVEGEWVTLLAEVFERLTAKHTSISYDFNRVTFEADRADSKGKYMPTGKVTITGKITITVG
jgi:hypothetical protein